MKNSKAVLILLLAISIVIAAADLPAGSKSKIAEPENVIWTVATNVTIWSLSGPTNALISFCDYEIETPGTRSYRDSVAIIYLPGSRHYHLLHRNHLIGRELKSCFFDFGGSTIAILPVNGYSAVAVISTNRIPDSYETGPYLEYVKRDYVNNWPSSIQKRGQSVSIDDIVKYFGDGKITTDTESGKTVVFEYRDAKGFTDAQILSIGTDGTNAVVAYDCIKEISEDRPVLTLDSKFRVVRAELNGKPLILNRTNNIYQRRDEDRRVAVETGANR